MGNVDNIDRFHDGEHGYENGDSDPENPIAKFKAAGSEESTSPHNLGVDLNETESDEQHHSHRADSVHPSTTPIIDLEKPETLLEMIRRKFRGLSKLMCKHITAK